MLHHALRLALPVFVLGLASTLSFNACSTAAAQELRAGAAAISIPPTSKESIIAGGFLEGRASDLRDSLWVRAIVLENGPTQMALVVVDTCMMPQPLIDHAKRIASERCGIPINHMLVSATHTHSAPAAMGCLGTRLDESYAAMLPEKIAEAIVQAHTRLEPASIGFQSVSDWEHTHNRRWIRHRDKKVVDPFGEATGLANMHPGYQSPDIIGPSGPVDPTLSVVSIRSRTGNPIAVYANYSQHYFGSPAISADYFGLFCKHMADNLDVPGEGNGPFVAALTQGTSGDLMWMDYGSPAKNITIEQYSEQVARYAEKAIDGVVYSDHAPIGIVEKTLKLRYRVPSASRLKWAEPLAASIENDLPKDLPQVYAREAKILHERQATELKVQALRIGDLTIAALPNEVYALTGLKLKAQSPAPYHFNVELANGAEGYIPPPEQHTLGGYTTWPARTAGLEISAEPQIVETLIQSLEEVTGKPRRPLLTTPTGPYSQRVMAMQPVGYWRLDDAEGNIARNECDQGKEGNLLGGYAFYLPGAGSGTGIGVEEALRPSAFSSPTAINRSIHFAGGTFFVNEVTASRNYTLAYWFWLGERSGASERNGILSVGPSGEKLIAIQGADHEVSLRLELPAPLGKTVTSLSSNRRWRADEWNFVAIQRRDSVVDVSINGVLEDALHTESATHLASALQCGVQLQGKLDEIAMFDRVLDADEVHSLWEISGIESHQRRARFLRERTGWESWPSDANLIVQESDIQRVRALSPVFAEPLNAPTSHAKTQGNIAWHPQHFAKLNNARIQASIPSIQDTYTVSLWFRNEIAPTARPVTAYLVSRGLDGAPTAPGDHLGIGGHYKPEWLGKLIVFNGNDRNQVLAGKSTLPVGVWQHVTMARVGDHVTVYLNDRPDPEIDGELPSTSNQTPEFFFGARSDGFAPLTGNIAHASVFAASLPAETIAELYRDTETALAENPSQPSGLQPNRPLTPDEAKDAIHVPPGYRVALAAVEPNVLDPVAFDWDLHGRLWVVEMADYPLGMDGQGQPGGRVRVLEDRDRDGVFEQSTLFAEGLSFPTSILCYRDGVLVTAAPKLWYLRDTDGDFKADEHEVLFEGFNEGNQQLRLNHLRYGLDGWVYCANGGHHPGHGVGIEVHSLRNGKRYALGSRDFRFRPETGDMELESGPSQFGRNRDAWGHWFGTQNSSPLWHYVLPERYMARNPHVPVTTSIRHVVPTGSPPVYPASQLEKRYHSFEQSGHFTSACSGMIYNDELLFGPTRSMHAFTCEPFHNLVQHNIVRPDGASYTSSRSVGEGPFDFFASEDRWCRPVMVRTGPDGALWVADMVRYMIEHPDWLPPEGKEELRPHYRLGDDCGRIWRVVPDQGVRAMPQLPTNDAVAMAKAMESTNDWQRNAVQQWILWKRPAEAISVLESIVSNSSIDEARLQAAYTLDCIGALRSPLLLSLLQPHHRPELLEGALRLSEQSTAPEIMHASLALAHHADLRVLMQLAFACGAWDTPEAGKTLAIIASQHPEDGYLRAAVMSSSLRHAKAFAESMTQGDAAALSAYRDPLIRQSVATGDTGTIAILLQHGLAQAEQRNATQLLDACLLDLQRLEYRWDAAFALPDSSELKNARQRLDAWATQVLKRTSEGTQQDTQSPAQSVSSYLPLMRLAETRAQAGERLVALLTPSLPSDAQAALLTTFAQSGSIDMLPAIAAAVPNLTPELAGRAIDIWLARDAWTNDLLERMERGELDWKWITPVQASRLREHADPLIAQRFKKVLEQSGVAADREQALARYAPALTGDANSERGMAVYQRACASCHQRGTSGTADVGPNLASVVSHSKEKLLRNILVPNADIQPGYFSFTCLLDSGEVVTGVLVNETANSIAIKQANAEVRSMARDQIEQLRNSGKSVMPDGLESNISIDEMRDLLEYLQQPIRNAK